jgi:hypothetical protein
LQVASARVCELLKLDIMIPTGPEFRGEKRGRLLHGIAVNLPSPLGLLRRDFVDSVWIGNSPWIYGLLVPELASYLGDS